MMNKTKPVVKFQTDKRGRREAYRWSTSAARWIRVSIDEAKIRIAAGDWVVEF